MGFFKKAFFCLFLAVLVIDPSVAHASRQTLVDAMDISPFIPLILDVFMMVAAGTYEFFVGSGIIQTFIWIFLGISIGMYAVKLFVPKKWLGFIGMSGGGELMDNKANPKTIIENVAKPCFRAVVAVVLLLGIKPIFVTEWLVNPFLQVGSIYTNAIISAGGGTDLVGAQAIECPQDIVSKQWISQESCEYLVQSVASLSHANNQVVKRGFNRFFSGIQELTNLLTPHGSSPFLDIISGLLIVFTFVGCNFFMGFLIIQGIFNFGMALILYPFNVLVWTTKPSDKWFDPLPPFSNIIKALQSLIITMIACAFILIINVALIRALLQWDTSIFVVAAHGSAVSNLPTAGGAGSGFGQHSIFWLTSILTFFVMKKIFDVTREQLKSYTKGMDGIYNQVKTDTKTFVSDVRSARKKYTKIFGKKD